MVSGILLWLGMASGVSAQTFQPCLWPNPCGPAAKNQVVRVSWDGQPSGSGVPVEVPAVVPDLPGAAEPGFSITPLSEIAKNPQAHLGRHATVGVLVSRCGKIAPECFSLKDPQTGDRIQVSAWLPIDAVYFLPTYGTHLHTMKELLGKKLWVSADLQKASDAPLYRLVIQDYKVLSSFQEFDLEYGGFEGRRWRLVPDTTPPGSEMALYVNQGDEVLLHLYREDFGPQISLDIDAFGVHAFFPGLSPEEQSVSFVVDRAGIFPIESHFSPRTDRVGLLIVRKNKKASR